MGVGKLNVQNDSKKRLYVRMQKNIRHYCQKEPLMKTEDFVVGLFVIIFAAILLGDAILTTFNPDDMMLSPNDVKGITGMVFVVLAVFILSKARK
jgi:hypothetical protein